MSNTKRKDKSRKVLRKGEWAADQSLMVSGLLMQAEAV